MQTIITGKAYVLGDNIDTDQIIPAQYLTFNPPIPEEYKHVRQVRPASVPADQAGLPKGHVPFHPDDEFVSALHDHRRRQELRLRLVARARPDRAGRGRHQGRRRRVLRPHLLPQLASTAATWCRSSASDRLCDRVCTGDEVEIDAAGSKLINHTTGEIVAT